MTMFQDNDRAARVGDAGASPQRVKRFKSIALGAAFAALTVSQTAIAQQACPTGPKRLNGADAAWNIQKIRDFGLWMGSPYKQLMLCLHRGLHTNIDDDGSDFSYLTRGVAEHTWPSILNAFQVAPCVELDFQYRDLTVEAMNNGSSNIVLSHESIGDRVMSKYDMVLGGQVANSPPANCDSRTKVPLDQTGRVKITCSGENLYTPATDTYRAPSNPKPFKKEDYSYGYGTDKHILTGTIKTSWSGDNDGTPNGIVNQKSLMEWVNRCRDGGNVGLIVADIKTYPSLVSFVSELKTFMAALPNATEKQEFARHWMVKTKPWKMRKSGDTSVGFTNLEYYAAELKRLDVPVIDTIAQAGTDNAAGSQPIAGVDAALAVNYYNTNASLNLGNAGRRAIEVVVPGIARFDPIRAGNFNIRVAKDCKNTGAIDRLLPSLREASRYCNTLARSASDKPYFPQIWGWVPLEDGRASKLQYANGNSATPALSGGLQYLSVNGKYPFGVASSNAAPFPFVIGKDTEERQQNYVPDILGARAITIDSITVFRNLYSNDYTTSQEFFFQ